MLDVLCSQNSFEYEIRPVVICDFMHSIEPGNLVDLLTRRYSTVHQLMY